MLAASAVASGRGPNDVTTAGVFGDGVGAVPVPGIHEYNDDQEANRALVPFCINWDRFDNCGLVCVFEKGALTFERTGLLRTGA